MKYRINSKYIFGCGTYYAVQVKYKYFPYWFTISSWFGTISKCIENAQLRGINIKVFE